MAIKAAVFVEGLHKNYGKVHALDGLNLVVEQGSITAILGPNGSGKTTTVRCLTTLTKPDSGRAEVAGFDVISHADEVRARIGLTGQFASVDDRLTGMENLEMFGRLYHLSKKTAKQRSQKLLEQFDLADVAGRFVKAYSGGMRRRLDIAASLIANPPILFLDEPTTGLDPRARIEVWDVIRAMVNDGTTVFLTTQNLEEADQLANQIIVFDHGHVIAQGTSEELKERIGGEWLELTAAQGSNLQTVFHVLQTNIADGEVKIDEKHRHLTVPITNGTQQIAMIIRNLDTAKIVLEDFALRRPTLDDVFLKLTGDIATKANKAEEKNLRGNNNGK